MATPTVKPKANIWLNTKTVQWDDMDDVRKACAGKPVIYLSKGLDLNGCQLVGTKLPKPKSDQDENSLPLRINIPGFVLRNGSVRGIPGGILGRKPKHQYLDLVFLDIGEDGLSNILDDSADWTIKGCRFYGASDKSVQLNDARGLTFIENYIKGGITGVRLQKKGGKYKMPSTRLIRDNEFDSVDTAWNISGEIQVKASGTRYRNVSQKVVSNTGAEFTERTA